MSPTMLVSRWFDSITGVAPETTAKLRSLVQQKLETGVCRHLLPKTMSEDWIAHAELKACVEQVITEQWDSLSPEERLLSRFPTVQKVGEYFDIPKRGRGLIVMRELTRRFGIEMVFQLQDGSFFKWEFID